MWMLVLNKSLHVSSKSRTLSKAPEQGGMDHARDAGGSCCLSFAEIVGFGFGVR